MTVGRLASQERYKGFDQVIELMPQLIKRFPNLKYLIVGEGSDRSRLEAKVEALGLSDHVFLPVTFLSPKRLRTIIWRTFTSCRVRGRGSESCY